MSHNIITYTLGIYIAKWRRNKLWFKRMQVLTVVFGRSELTQPSVEWNDAVNRKPKNPRHWFPSFHFRLGWSWLRLKSYPPHPLTRCWYEALQLLRRSNCHVVVHLINWNIHKCADFVPSLGHKILFGLRSYEHYCLSLDPIICWLHYKL